MVWGYAPPDRHGMPCHVSIVCPAADREVILTWARAAGWEVYCCPSSSCCSSSSEEGDGEGGGEIIGVPLSVPGLPTQVWGFRLRTVGGEAWGRLRRVRLSEEGCVGWAGEVIRTRAQVMAVGSLVDEFARAWYFCVVREGGGGGVQERHIAGLLLWALRRVAAGVERYGTGGIWKLTPENVPCFVYGGFLGAFLGMYPEALELLELCGLHGIKV